MTPWVTSDAERITVEEGLTQLLGETVERVIYVETDSHLPLRLDASIHEVSMAVELIMSSGRRLICAWLVEGGLEGLFIGPSDKWKAPRGATRRYDASLVSSWPSRRGHRIKAVACGWEETSEEGFNSLWTLRLVLEDCDDVIIALGEFVENRIEYISDSILVLFDESEARAYTPSGAFDSAWGGIVATLPALQAE